VERPSSEWNCVSRWVSPAGRSKLDQPPQLSYAPGASPLHVKGLGIEGFLTFCEDRVTGGAAAVRAALPDEPLRAFFRQTFLIASWYDFLPVLCLYRTAARLAGTFTTNFLAEHSVWQVKRDYQQGAQRLFIK